MAKARVLHCFRYSARHIVQMAWGGVSAQGQPVRSAPGAGG